MYFLKFILFIFTLTYVSVGYSVDSGKDSSIKIRDLKYYDLGAEVWGVIFVNSRGEAFLSAPVSGFLHVLSNGVIKEKKTFNPIRHSFLLDPTDHSYLFHADTLSANSDKHITEIYDHNFKLLKTIDSPIILPQNSLPRFSGHSSGHDSLFVGGGYMAGYYKGAIYLLDYKKGLEHELLKVTEHPKYAALCKLDKGGFDLFVNDKIYSIDSTFKIKKTSSVKITSGDLGARFHCWENQIILINQNNSDHVIRSLTTDRSYKIDCSGNQSEVFRSNRLFLFCDDNPITILDKNLMEVGKINHQTQMNNIILSLGNSLYGYFNKTEIVIVDENGIEKAAFNLGLPFKMAYHRIANSNSDGWVYLHVDNGSEEKTISFKIDIK